MRNIHLSAVPFQEPRHNSFSPLPLLLFERFRSLWEAKKKKVLEHLRIRILKGEKEQRIENTAHTDLDTRAEKAGDASNVTSKQPVYPSDLSTASVKRTTPPC